MPTGIVFCGFEIGIKIFTGRNLERTPVDNPVREAYRLFHHGEFKDRWSWDQTTVLAAIRGAKPFGRLQQNGYNFIREDGWNEWRDGGRPGHHAYLVQTQSIESTRRIIDTLMSQRVRRR